MLLLTTLGCLNLYQVWVTPKGQRVQARGLWRAQLLSRLLSMPIGFSQAAWCFAIGALFALSFDTLSQASLFALSSNEQGSPWFALVLALAFTAGMMLTDGVNGWLVAEVLSRSDRTGWVASRLLSVLVALLSFTVAGLGASKWLIPQWGAWLSEHAAWLGLGLTALVVGAGLGFARSPRHIPKDQRC
jgi:high-affinity nickel-transport protein